ncbi:MAG: hypothetical protein ABFQ64_07380 [Campylobacterota bacterium]
MKPLLAKDLAAFMQRFNNFKDGEFRSLEVISPTTMKIALAGQDEARAFDWVSIELEFNGVSDAKLLDSSKLHLVDMGDGINLIDDGGIAFGVGEYDTLSSIKNSLCYIVCSDIKYQEANF